MESPRKFNDCYFYYYSTCTKGDNCVFRHEPSALGCETMCESWQQGKCLDKHCKLRHMELRKNRKQIPCYWETQPGGCRKKHCPFMHKNPDARTDGIAPSQPAPAVPAQSAATSSETVPTEQAPISTGVSQTVATPAPVSMLWQQQRQVVLDSAILGVVPAGGVAGVNAANEMRRLLPAHAHAHAHVHAHPHAHAHDSAAYAPLPVDSLVVNFEEESDNESAPSTTPTKNPLSDEAQGVAQAKSQELLLLEKIQAETAALYSFDSTQSIENPKERNNRVRTNLAPKYEKLSLDEISGNKQANDRDSSLDFKVLTLDEIRSKKKTLQTVFHSTPVTLNLKNLNRKRKLSAHETITNEGNKIIKVVRSNSVIYRKVVPNTSNNDNSIKIDCSKQSETKTEKNRKRTISEQCSDIYNLQENELVDNCFEFKKIKLTEQMPKPKLVRNTTCNNDKSKESLNSSTSTTESVYDSELHNIVSIDITDEETSNSQEKDCEILYDDVCKMATPVEVLDLSDEDCDLSNTKIDCENNVPDIVASCQKNIYDTIEVSEQDVIFDLDALCKEL